MIGLCPLNLGSHFLNDTAQKKKTVPFKKCHPFPYIYNFHPTETSSIAEYRLILDLALNIILHCLCSVYSLVSIGITYLNKMLTLDCARSISESKSLTDKFLSFINCDWDICRTLSKNRKWAQRTETRNGIEKKRKKKMSVIVSKIYPESGKEDDDSPWLTLARFLDTHVTTPRGFR